MDNNNIKITLIGSRWFVGIDKGEDGLELMVNKQTKEFICFDSKSDAIKYIDLLEVL